jgi:hypothetical protein
VRRGLSLRHPGLAQAVNEAFALGEINRIIAHGTRTPEPHREARIKSKSRANRVPSLNSPAQTQLSAMRLSGDLNMRPENVNLEELLASIREEWAKLGPLIEMGPGAPQGSRTEGGLTVGRRKN